MSRAVRKDEVERIHEKSLEILQRIGVDFQHPQVVELLGKKGIKTDGYRVFFDPRTVEEALKTLQSEFVIETPFSSLKIGGGGKAISTASGAIHILKDGKIRYSTLEDFINGRKLDDTSPLVNLLCTPFIFAADLPEEESEMVKMALALRYSQKPLIASCYSEKTAGDTIDFIRKFYGSPQGYYTIGVENMISPLRYTRDDTGAILSYIRRGQPVVIACCSTPGYTSPVTVGGTIVQNNAEVLAGMVMTQLLRPGVPIVYGNITYSADMRRGVPVSWGPEIGVFMKYAKAMADYYGVPCRVGGSLSGSKQLDWQDGAQSAASLAATLDCDADFMFQMCGGLDCLRVFSFEKYVLDEEFLLSCMWTRNKEFITEDAVDVELMLSVGPGGSYIAREETAVQYGKELYASRLFHNEDYGSSVNHRAKQLVQERLERYEMPRYEKWQEEMLREVLD